MTVLEGIIALWWNPFLKYKRCFFLSSKSPQKLVAKTSVLFCNICGARIPKCPRLICSEILVVAVVTWRIDWSWKMHLYNGLIFWLANYGRFWWEVSIGPHIFNRVTYNIIADLPQSEWFKKEQSKSHKVFYHLASGCLHYHFCSILLIT